MTNNDTVSQIVNSRNVYIETPAGCGKTYLISKCVSKHTDGKQLILTHTHAGVRVLKDRMKEFNVKSSDYSVHTIDSFILKYTSSYPALSGCEINRPEGKEWESIRLAGCRLFQKKIIEKVIRRSYSGLYVDEYQDCSLSQHNFIFKLRELLPTRIFADPLQGIFDFDKNEKIISWKENIKPYFSAIKYDPTPWRWKGKNEKLGKWLLEIRSKIINGENIDLDDRFIEIYDNNHAIKYSVCRKIIDSKKGNMVFMHRMPAQAHGFAKRFRGSLTSMEEVECSDLLKWSNKFEVSRSNILAVNIIDFASECISNISVELKTIKTKFKKNDCNWGAISRHKNIADILNLLKEEKDYNVVVTALNEIKNIKGCYLYRKELWYEMLNTLRSVDKKVEIGLKELAWHTRNKSRIFGRIIPLRAVSRVLLIKGLEFDHAVIFGIEDLNPKELYVALTRGCKSVTVFSSRKTIKKAIPEL